MASYHVNRNAQANGDLGDHASCHVAVTEAQRYYPTANGCAFCCPDCHSS